MEVVIEIKSYFKGRTLLFGKIFYVVVFFLSILVLTSSCQKNPTNIEKYEWQSLGFENKFALRMVLAEPYLYVCAGSDGLWRMDIRRITPWEYLGLADTTLGRYANVGVLDVDVKGQDILVAYNGSAPHIHPDSTVAIWRST